MRRGKKRKQQLISILFVLLSAIGIGFALLRADLKIVGVYKINNAKWDIYFDNIQISPASVALSTGDSAPTIAQDKTTINYTITLNKPGDYYEFTVDVKNDGDIDAMVESVSFIVNGNENNPLPTYLQYRVSYLDTGRIPAANHVLLANTQRTYKVKLEFKKDIDNSELPNTLQTNTISFGVTYMQSDENAIEPPTAAMMANIGQVNAAYLQNETIRSKIKTIRLEDQINIPNNTIYSWNIGSDQPDSVVAFVISNKEDSSMYDLYIQGDGALIANPNSRELFRNLTNVENIYNIEVLNTSKVENMQAMFYETGYNSTNFKLNLGNNFDTSKVKNMQSMFYKTGFNSTNFTLDLGNHFDTSKVENMSEMFYRTGYYSDSFTLNLGENFDTSNVEYMSKMFSEVGYNGQHFTLDLGNKFDTSKVKDMDNMFSYAGYQSTSFTLNLGNLFDTSNVLDMDSMFYRTGSNSQVFSLNLGDNFNTHNVTDMSYMFSGTGFRSPIFTLNLGNNFDTSNVTNMTYMFSAIGSYNDTFTLNLGSKFDTSKVTNMSYMFFQFARYSQSFTLDLGPNFDTSEVTNMSHMFRDLGYESTVFTLDLGSKFDTSKVTNFTDMFAYSGCESTSYTLILGDNFSLENAIDLGYNLTTGDVGIFGDIGLNDPHLELDISMIDFTNVETHGISRIFSGMKSTSTIYVKDETARTWVLNHREASNIHSNNVVIKQ